MILFPAIDLKDGKCVRLARGRADDATIYSDNPADQAAQFVAAGCAWLHIVDLDGAFGGRSVNSEPVSEILSQVDVPVQLGGGIRDLKVIERWLRYGVSRVVLGTAAVQDPDFVKAAARSFPGQLAVGIDVHDGFAATHGWVKTSQITAVDLARRFEDCAISAIIFTDIERDGMKTGVNIESTCNLAENVDIPVIASGGISSRSDLSELSSYSDQLAGVIVGRALYDGSITITDALASLAGDRNGS